MSYIAKFNPYRMDDKTILSVATGRTELLNQVLKVLADNLESSSIPQQLLIRGPRGMGKSFFLKLIQIHFRKDEKFDHCDFLLLPEEQNNIHSTTDLIKLILKDLNPDSTEALINLWDEPDDLWQIELSKLMSHIKEQKEKNSDYLLVVVLENLDEFLKNIQTDKKTRKQNESRFRHLLESVEGLSLIGAIPRIDSDAIDGDYNGRLFHAFKKCNLKRWTEVDYFDYFEKRKAIKVAETGAYYSPEQNDIMRAKLKAISHFTGGSPRIAVVLTNLLLEEDVISTANTLYGLIDDLTPYYQDLTKSIPPKSKILFDSLIRQGENLSQSELAKIVGATQSKISKAFLWLKDNGYIVGQKRSDSPAFSYWVADRVYVLYYQLREIHHNKQISPVWLLSDFLVNFYRENELKEQAAKYLNGRADVLAIDMAKVYLLSTEIYKEEELPDLETAEEWLALIKEIPEENEKVKLLFDLIDEVVNRYSEKNVKTLDMLFHIFSITYDTLIEFNIQNRFIKMYYFKRYLISYYSFCAKDIIISEKEGEFVLAFQSSNDMLVSMKNNSMELFISDFFSCLIQEGISKTLLKDIAEEALNLFPEPEHQLVIQAALNSVEYLEGGKQDVFLEKLAPDMAIAVRAIVEGGGLSE